MKTPYIAGISGGTASGKTTFTNWLETQLTGFDVRVFHMDGYFKPDSVRPKAAAHVTGKVYFDDNCPETIYHEKLREDIAKAVQEGPDVILVEGLFALWYDWLYAQLDLKLFIDCDADERIVRRLRRNMAQRGLSFEEIAGVYLDMVRYRHQQYIEPTKWRADLILNGSTPSETANRLVAGHIRAEAERRISMLGSLS